METLSNLWSWFFYVGCNGKIIYLILWVFLLAWVVFCTKVFIRAWEAMNNGENIFKL